MIVRLALVAESSTITLRHGRGLEPPPALVSYVYLRNFDKLRDRIAVRDWVMDSGAFSAHNSGKPIDLQQYIGVCQHRLATDPQLTEVFALDVIGDWRAGLKNTEAMWKVGVPAIPTFHPGREPWDLVTKLARDYPKVAVGGWFG